MTPAEILLRMNAALVQLSDASVRPNRLIMSPEAYDAYKWMKERWRLRNRRKRESRRLRGKH